MPELLERKPLPLNYSYLDKFDVVIFGSGLAGLSAAYYASNANNSVALIYSSSKESSSFKAKGGIAVPISKGDSIQKHVNDTLNAGAELNNRKAVEFIVRKSIPQLKELIDLGLKFDEVNGRIHLGKEGGHSENRVLHIHGDETGKGLLEFFQEKVEEKNIHLIPETTLVELKSESNRVSEAVVYSKEKGFHSIKAKSFVIATGGYSSIYLNSTNSPQSTGSALSAAFRAGITLQDLEFMQFHPTTIKEKKSNYLITESVRGEKAKIINSNGERFLKNYSPMAELATRDIISKAIYEEEFKGNKVFMDVNELGKEHIKQRFPSFYAELNSLNLNPDKELIPITPSAHYCIGGIKTDLNARSNVSNVFSAGESACTGFHGANRLACNSLLETIVMGRIAGEQAAKNAKKNDFISVKKQKSQLSMKKSASFSSPEKNLQELRKTMWLRAGIKKSKKHLLQARKSIESITKDFSPNQKSIDSINCFSAMQLSNLVVSFALNRRESRGVHQRIDFKTKRKKWEIHQEI